MRFAFPPNETSSTKAHHFGLMAEGSRLLLLNSANASTLISITSLFVIVKQPVRGGLDGLEASLQHLRGNAEAALRQAPTPAVES